MQMSFVEIKEEEYQAFFKWLLDRDVKMCKELDITLAKEYEEPYIYYCQEIEAFFQTTAMQRTRKIQQLATSQLHNSDAYHSRLDHGKGAYKNGLDFWLLRCKDAKYKEKIEKEDKKLEILADIMQLARHDDCHSMLSHGLEPLLCNGMVKHEAIGKRILLENKEYRETLNQIKLGLYELMCKHEQEENDTFRCLKDGNIDFDRMDYLIRDAFYLGYPNARELIETLNKYCKIKQIKINETKIEVPVYFGKGINAAQDFLRFRKKAYEAEYYSVKRSIEDQTLQLFCRKMVDDETPYGKFLKVSIQNYLKETIEQIDIDQFLETDDIKFYNDAIEIAKFHPNENMRELARQCIPSLSGLIQITIHMLDTKNHKGKYEPSEEKLIKNIQELRKEDTDLSRKLKHPNQYKEQSVTMIPTDEQEYQKISNQIREELEIGKEQEIQGVFRWKRTIRTYNPNNPIYVEEEDGRVVPLDQYSQLDLDMKEKKVYGICINPIVMKLEGYADNEIEQVIGLLNQYKQEDICKKKTLNMSMFKTESEPYIIGIE